MKYKISLIIFTVLLFSSCSEEFLNVDSQTALTVSTFYNTETDFQQAVNGTYAPLRTLYNGAGENGAWVMGEMHSDNTRYILNPNYRATIDQENLADFIHEPANGIIELKYTTNYLIIARANQVLALIDEADFDQAQKDKFKGETLFLRALAYFDLVQYFGRVPLHLEPATTRDETSLPLAEVNVIYDQIISDAGEAANLLPPKSQQEAGRATSGAAKTLLGNVYAVLKDWSNAESVLQEVVSSNEYELLDEYADVFDPNNKNHAESVFEVQFLEGTGGFASDFIYDFLPRPATAEEIAAITGTPDAQALTTEAYNVPSPDLIAAYEAGDLRRDASIGEARLNSGIYPYIKKYVHPHAQHGITNENFPVYRYSEVLLLLAEAMNEQGKSAEGPLNEVRDRAGLDPTTASGQDGLRTAILQERRVELAFENKRWLDLVRTGNAVSVITAYGQRIKADPQAYYYPEGLEPAPAAFSTIDLMFPLPASEAALSEYF